MSRDHFVAHRVVAAGMLALPLSAMALPSGLGDPTRPTDMAAPAQAAVPKGPRWKLQSTLVSGDRRVAVINGRALQVGEQVDGARVAEIGPDQVILDRGGRRVTLKLESVQVKKPSEGPRQ